MISFTFSFAKVFSCNYLITFLVSFIWYSQKCPVSQNIWCLFKTQLKHITQTIFQRGSPWATLIHNSVVCLEVHYCVQLLSWGHDFLMFSIISFTFSFAKVFSRERLRRVLRKKAAVILDLHTFTPADLDLHTFTPADLDLHTLTPADLDLHTFTPADLDLHTFTPADLHLYTFTSADLHLHTFTPSHLQIYIFRPSHLQI